MGGRREELPGTHKARIHLGEPGRNAGTRFRRTGSVRAAVETLHSNTVAVYTGSTKRSLVEEALRWLTERGANNDNYHETRQRNRPVWRYPNNDIIGMKDATEVLGAKSFFVYYCPLILGACYVEPTVRPLLSFFFSINPNTT